MCGESEQYLMPVGVNLNRTPGGKQIINTRGREQTLEASYRPKGKDHRLCFLCKKQLSVKIHTLLDINPSGDQTL